MVAMSKATMADFNKEALMDEPFDRTHDGALADADKFRNALQAWVAPTGLTVVMVEERRTDRLVRPGVALRQAQSLERQYRIEFLLCHCESGFACQDKSFLSSARRFAQL